MTTAFKAIGATITNRAEATQFAHDLGVITHETVANAWVTQAEQDFMDPRPPDVGHLFRMIGWTFIPSSLASLRPRWVSFHTEACPK